MDANPLNVFGRRVFLWNTEKAQTGGQLQGANCSAVDFAIALLLALVIS
jgi:hypothetical protein